MTNNDVLRRLRFALNLKDSQLIELFRLGGLTVAHSNIKTWLLDEEEEAYQVLEDTFFAAFLNGLIVDKRGKKDGDAPPLDSLLTNNIILRKLKIAFQFKDDDILSILSKAGMPLSRHELSALFRKEGHKNFKECKDQFLRNFLRGLQEHLRPMAVSR